jgi:small subunit ribosomal protein S2
MALPEFSMRELIEAGVHFGHKTKRWNPRMAPYLYGVRNGLHIIDLQQTVPLLHRALVAVREAVAGNGRVLFVGTKRQAADPVAEAAKRCGQYYINQRWLGGMLTNWNTIQASIKRLRKIDEVLEKGDSGLTKKEILTLTRDREKLERSLGGIKDMGGLPNLIFIIDTNKEDLAVKEAARLGIPVVGILDSNSSPDSITYPVPGNDDATRAIRLYCQLIADAALDGLQESLAKNSADIGESAEVPFAKTGEDAKLEAAKAEKEEGEKRHPRGGKQRHEKQEKKAPVVVKKAAKLKEGDEPKEQAAPETQAQAEASSEEAKEAKKPAKKVADKAPKAKKAS